MTNVEHDVQKAAGSSAAALQGMFRGFMVTQMIYVAAQLGIADLLAAGAKTAGDLAAATGTHEPSLYRLLRALAGLGIFAEDEQGRFGLTPLSEPLQAGAANSVRASVLYLGSPTCQRVWGDLLHSVTTGEDGFRHLFGMANWAYREQHPDENTRFNHFMTEQTRPEAAAVTAAYDFTGMKSLVDVGGGQGSLVAEILKANPTLHAVVFDQPHVVSGAAATLAAAGVSDRCELVGGDFFAEVPGGADGYILKSIIHDWDDARSNAILKVCRRAIQPAGKLLVVEFVIPPGNTPHPGKLSDINMLVAPGGQERTEAEFDRLLAGAGFRLSRVIPLQTGKSIIEALPV